MISGEILNWYGSFCCWIVNNALDFFFSKSKYPGNHPEHRNSIFISNIKKNILFYLDYVATNYRGNSDRHHFNHCWEQICKLRHVSNEVLFNWFRLLNSPLCSPFSRWHIKITYLSFYCEKVVYPGRIWSLNDERWEHNEDDWLTNWCEMNILSRSLTCSARIR